MAWLISDLRIKRDHYRRFIYSDPIQICYQNFPITWSKPLVSLLFSNGTYAEENKVRDNDALPKPMPIKPDGFVSSIRILSLRNCSLSEIPALPPKLTSLCLESNLLKELCSDEKFWPKTLEKIYVQSNHLVSLPECWSQLKDLRELCCHDNNLKRLPEMRHIRYLNCSINRIERLPACLWMVQTLLCSDNKIKHLPPLPKIRRLIVSKNLIRGFGRGINPDIIYVKCNRTPILSLPTNWNCVTDLNISSTRIATIPINILSSVDTITNISTPLLYIPPSLRHNVILAQPIDRKTSISSVLARFQRRIIRWLITKRLCLTDPVSAVPLPILRIIASYVPRTGNKNKRLAESAGGQQDKKKAKFRVPPPHTTMNLRRAATTTAATRYRYWIAAPPPAKNNNK